MGSWTPTVKLGPFEFDGDQVTVVATRLLVEDMAELMKHVDPVSKKLRFDDPSQLCSMASRIIPKYLKAVEGCMKADGAAMSVDELAVASGEFYFVPLIGRVFAELMAASTVKGTEAKNSEAPSAD